MPTSSTPVKIIECYCPFQALQWLFLLFEMVFAYCLQLCPNDWVLMRARLQFVTYFCYGALLLAWLAEQIFGQDDGKRFFVVFNEDEPEPIQQTPQRSKIADESKPIEQTPQRSKIAIFMEKCIAAINSFVHGMLSIFPKVLFFLLILLLLPDQVQAHAG